MFPRVTAHIEVRRRDIRAAARRLLAEL